MTKSRLAASPECHSDHREANYDARWFWDNDLWIHRSGHSWANNGWIDCSRAGSVLEIRVPIHHLGNAAMIGIKTSRIDGSPIP